MARTLMEVTMHRGKLVVRVPLVFLSGNPGVATPFLDNLSLSSRVSLIKLQAHLFAFHLTFGES